MNQSLFNSIEYLEKVLIEMNKRNMLDINEQLMGYSSIENIKIHFFRNAIKKYQFQENLTNIFNIIDKQRGKGTLTFETCHYLFIAFSIVNQYVNHMIW